MSQLTIRVIQIREGDSDFVCAVRVVGEQNGATITIAESPRFNTQGPNIDTEPVENTIARAMRNAADWIERGPIDLQMHKGRGLLDRSVSRTPVAK